ncbi:hypothetical protein ACSSV1_003084 [Labrenzia sp. MBR-25]
MENFLGTFLGGIGVSSVIGLAWLSFFHPIIFDRFVGRILITATGIMLVVEAYLIGHMDGASAQLGADSEKLRKLDILTRPSLSSVDGPISLLQVFLVFGAVFWVASS